MIKSVAQWLIISSFYTIPYVSVVAVEHVWVMSVFSVYVLPLGVWKQTQGVGVELLSSVEAAEYMDH